MNTDFSASDAANWERLTAYLAGEGTPDDRAATEHWLASDPEWSAAAQRLSPAFFPRSVRLRRTWNTQGMWDRVQAATTESCSETVTVATTPPVTRAVPRGPRVMRQAVPAWGRYAMGTAAAAVLIAVGWVTLGTPHARQTPAAAREYTTTRAQRATFTLPDGSYAMLGPASRIRFSVSGNARKVELEGQAYFTVVHDPQHLFAVQAGDVITRVLGTSFSVRAYDTDRVAQIAVAEGKVAIEATGAAPAILQAGDVGRVEPGQAPVVTHDARIGDAFGWTRGQLVFEDTQLQEAVPDLERAYDVTIRIDNTTLARRHITLTLAGEPLAVALTTIASALDATYTQQGRNITILPRRSTR